ncbi:unnamed protein product [Cuscuta campestris]|uniref:Uncharacterized protein n=1 Tax=Cuscuta campestris TaxID=132261 RepID=A0A484KUD2_9ASTE|nr:unnamed protein product [Cuscuta campestris]
MNKDKRALESFHIGEIQRNGCCYFIEMFKTRLLLRFLPYSLMKIKCEKRGLGRTYESEYLGLRKMISYQALFYFMQCCNKVDALQENI